MEWGVSVLYPDASRVEDPADTDIPVLYLLHGMNGNHHSWLKRTNVERILRNTNLIVVLPIPIMVFTQIPSMATTTTQPLRRNCQRLFLASSLIWPRNGRRPLLLVYPWVAMDRCSWPSRQIVSLMRLVFRCSEFPRSRFWKQWLGTTSFLGRGSFGEIEDWTTSPYSLETAAKKFFR